MSLLLPESGLVFWMLLVFGVVVFVLVKFGFPVILKMVEDRKLYIEESITMAEKARVELKQVKTEGEQIIANARKEHQAILADAALLREKLVNEARVKALSEAEKVIEESRLLIQHEKETAIKEIRNQVAELSIDIAEKLIGQQLSKSTEQEKMIQRLLDEIEVPKSYIGFKVNL